MRATLHIAHDTDAQREALRLVVEALASINLAWIEAQRADGLEPPCCTHCAEPPWCAHPVRYVPHHGAPLGDARDYYDGPTMFHLRSGTCADIVAYDVAAARAKGKQAHVAIEGNGPHYHAVAYVDGQRKDPTADVARRTNALCSCTAGEH